MFFILLSFFCSVQSMAIPLHYMLYCVWLFMGQIKFQWMSDLSFPKNDSQAILNVREQKKKRAGNRACPYT